MKKLYVGLTLAAVWLSVGLQGAEETNELEVIIEKSSSMPDVYYAFVTLDKDNRLVDAIREALFRSINRRSHVKTRNINDYTTRGYKDLLLVSYDNIFALLEVGKTIAELVGQNYTTEDGPGINCTGTVVFTISEKKSLKNRFSKKAKTSQGEKPQGAPAIKKDSTDLYCQSLFNTRSIAASKAGKKISDTTKKWKQSLSRRKGSSIDIDVRFINFVGAEVSRNNTNSIWYIFLANGDTISIVVASDLSSRPLSGRYTFMDKPQQPVNLNDEQVKAIKEVAAALPLKNT